MSDGQIRQAAARGRKVTFQFLSVQPVHEITGYIVGMDDYHWFIAGVVPADRRLGGPIEKLLVHKARPDAILLHDANTLDSEPTEVRDALVQVGQSFWDLCNTRTPR